MAQGRWYPAATTMANGQVVILAGSDEDGTNVLVPEVWNPGALTALPGASRSFPSTPARSSPRTDGCSTPAADHPLPQHHRAQGSWTTVANRRSPPATTARPRCTRRQDPLRRGGRTTNSAETTISTGPPRPGPHRPDGLCPPPPYLRFSPPARCSRPAASTAPLQRPVGRCARGRSRIRTRDLAHAREQRRHPRLSRHLDLLPDGRPGTGTATPGARGERRTSRPLTSSPVRARPSARPRHVGYNTVPVVTPQRHIGKVSLIRLGSATTRSTRPAFSAAEAHRDATGLTV